MNSKRSNQGLKKARTILMLGLKIVCLTYVTNACSMGRKSSIQYDQPRDKRYSAFVYVGDFKFRKSSCVNRGKKTGKCYKWVQTYLDLNKKEDSEFVKSSMILMNEAGL